MRALLFTSRVIRNSFLHPLRFTSSSPHSVASRLYSITPMASSSAPPQQPQSHKIPRRIQQLAERYVCPACGQSCHRPIVFHRHIERCCADLLTSYKEEIQRNTLSEATTTTPATTDTSTNNNHTEDDTTNIDDTMNIENITRPKKFVLFLDTPHAINKFLDYANPREKQLHTLALDIAFRQTDDNGNQIKQGPQEIATALRLHPARAERLLKTALKSIPMHADDGPVEIIYQDEDVVALNKAPGVITAPKHRFTGSSLVNRLIGKGFDPKVIHRLDMNTSGAVIFGLTKESLPKLHEQFRERQAKKKYWAIIIGIPQEERFTVDAPIGRNDNDKYARMVRYDEDGDTKPALTSFRVLAKSATADLSTGTVSGHANPSVGDIKQGAALVECEPLTGRTHQIRVHLAHAGHPIIGDDLYGITGEWIDRQALHAAKLRLQHPREEKGDLELCAPLPEDMRKALEMLNIEWDGECSV